jgi:hypothetical protein
MFILIDNCYNASFLWLFNLFNFYGYNHWKAIYINTNKSLLPSYFQTLQVKSITCKYGPSLRTGFARCHQYVIVQCTKICCMKFWFVCMWYGITCSLHMYVCTHIHTYCCLACKKFMKDHSLMETNLVHFLIKVASTWRSKSSGDVTPC